MSGKLLVGDPLSRNGPKHFAEAAPINGFALIETEHLLADGSCPIPWCSCGVVITALSGEAGMVILPGWTG